MEDWIVKGTASDPANADPDTGVAPWVPFEITVSAEDKEHARWVARRQVAPGAALAELEGHPPNAERERVEVAQGQRDALRTPTERDEYDRLVQLVHIDSVLRPGESDDEETE